jgi:hypothetical protein
MRKTRHNLTPIEEAALAADLALRDMLSTKALMRKYDASRTLIDNIKRKMRSKKQNVLIEIHSNGEGIGKIG